MRCRSCDADIDFVTLPSGKKMPVEGLDVETYYLRPDHGFVDSAHPRLVIVTDDGTLVRGRQAGSHENGVLRVEGRESHFARCPGAKEHRKS